MAAKSEAQKFLENSVATHEAYIMSALTKAEMRKIGGKVEDRMDDEYATDELNEAATDMGFDLWEEGALETIWFRRLVGRQAVCNTCE